MKDQYTLNFAILQSVQSSMKKEKKKITRNLDKKMHTFLPWINLYNALVSGHRLQSASSVHHLFSLLVRKQGAGVYKYV